MALTSTQFGTPETQLPPFLLKEEENLEKPQKSYSDPVSNFESTSKSERKKIGRVTSVIVKKPKEEKKSIRERTFSNFGQSTFVEEKERKKIYLDFKEFHKQKKNSQRLYDMVIEKAKAIQQNSEKGFDVLKEMEKDLEEIAKAFYNTHDEMEHEKDRIQFRNTLKYFIEYENEACRALVCKIYKNLAEESLGKTIYKEYKSKKACLEKMIFSLVNVDMKMIAKVDQSLFRLDAISGVLIGHHLRNLLKKSLENFLKFIKGKLKSPDKYNIDEREVKKEMIQTNQNNFKALMRDIISAASKIDFTPPSRAFIKQVMSIVLNHPNNKDLKEIQQVRRVLFNNIFFNRGICPFLVKKMKLSGDSKENEGMHNCLIKISKVFQTLSSDATFDSIKDMSFINEEILGYGDTFQNMMDKVFA